MTQVARGLIQTIALGKTPADHAAHTDPSKAYTSSTVIGSIETYRSHHHRNRVCQVGARPIPSHYHSPTQA